MSYLLDLKSKSIVIVGAGVTGGALVNFCLAHGITPIVIDEAAATLAGLKVISEISVGMRFDIAIVSPGWRRDHKIIQDLIQSGTEIIGEVDFAWKVRNELAPNQKWVAITGTNGKTTTVQMIQSIFTAADFKGTICGNVGVPVISAVASSQSWDFLCLELSSFQIDWSNEAKFEAVGILNIAEDHIDWHKTFDEYANTKLKLLTKTRIAVLSAADSEIVLRSSAWNGKKIFYSLESPQSGEIGLVESILVDRAFIEEGADAKVLAELSDIQPTIPHNVLNSMAAAALCLSIGIGREDIRRGLTAFTLDHHRMETILERNEITWINDSKATNPHAAMASILSHRSVIWIAGGLAKGASMDELVKRVRKRLKSVILIGTDQQLIADALREYAPEVAYYELISTEDSYALMGKIISKANELANPGDTVLLAPACASMDQFVSYADRGNLFAQVVREQIGSGGDFDGA